MEFGIDGYLCSIDFSSERAEKLRDRLTAYRGFGQRSAAATLGAPMAAKSAPNRGGKERNRAIRPWGEEHRLPVEVRGKLSDEVITKYDAAHTEPA
ncbi:Lsr2 family protein [Glycomyces sp. TRM65418]|nr:histone-like nucleoid-structuring protein Lsr2 [Glycomyces sp. TRM65418]MCC3765163.1 Lsr2 family protein [Glycomyces sp. TRM65418]QZD54789.1 Lsr2 family protein [Glycomyces sp. TRM65418]